MFRLAKCGNVTWTGRLSVAASAMAIGAAGLSIARPAGSPAAIGYSAVEDCPTSPASAPSARTKPGAWAGDHNSSEPWVQRAVALNGSSAKCSDGAT